MSIHTRRRNVCVLALVNCIPIEQSHGRHRSDCHANRNFQTYISLIVKSIDLFRSYIRIQYDGITAFDNLPKTNANIKEHIEQRTRYI